MKYESKELNKNPSLKQLAYEKLQMDILMGYLEPGTRLMEEELSDSLHISRAPIREALNMLERDGFVVIVPRKGAVVSSATRKEAKDILEMRRLLEPYAAAQSIKLITEDEVRRVEHRLNEVLEDPTDVENYMESRLDVHELFYKHLDNGFLTSVLENIIAHSMRLRWAVERTDSDFRADHIIESTREHLKLIASIREGDGEALSALVLEHLNRSMSGLIG